MNRVFVRLIDALAIVLLASGSLAGAFNVLNEAPAAAGWGQRSVVVGQVLYIVAGLAVLLAWRRNARWLAAALWLWGTGMVWAASAATAFYGAGTAAAVAPALLSSAVIAAVTGWWITLRAAMRTPGEIPK
jgi:hypothetical protein